MLAALSSVLAVAALSLALLSGSGSWWALLGFTLIMACATGLRARREQALVRQTDPSQGVGRRELGGFACVAVGVVLVTILLHSI